MQSASDDGGGGVSHDVTALAQRDYIGCTADVRPGHALDTVRLGAWMRDAIPRFRGPLDVRKFAPVRARRVGGSTRGGGRMSGGVLRFAEAGLR